MTDFIEENIRDEMIDLDDLPDSLIYKLPEIEFTFSAEKFGVNEHLHIEYYEQRLACLKKQSVEEFLHDQGFYS